MQRYAQDVSFTSEGAARNLHMHASMAMRMGKGRGMLHLIEQNSLAMNGKWNCTMKTEDLETAVPNSGIVSLHTKFVLTC